MPVAVQNTLRQYSLDAPIEDIDKGTIGGQAVYQAAFKHNGQNIELQVAQNGSLIRDNVNDQYLASVGMSPTGSTMAQARPAYVPDWRTAPVRVPLSGASQVRFRDVPQPVRERLLSYSGGTPVGEIKRGMIGGQTVYEAALQSAGQKTQLRLTDTGALINDQVNDRFLAQLSSGQGSPSAVGQAPSWQSLSGSGSSGLAPLSNATSVAFNQLPDPVQTTVRAQAGFAPIDSTTQGVLEGKIVYNAAFTQGSRKVQLRVAHDGSVLGSQSSSQ